MTLPLTCTGAPPANAAVSVLGPKRCSHCNRTKPPHCFRMNTDKRLRTPTLYCYCRKCEARIMRERRAASLKRSVAVQCRDLRKAEERDFLAKPHEPAPRLPSGEWRNLTERACNRCGVVKPMAAFYMTKSGGRAYPRADCKECGRIRTRIETRKWRARKPKQSSGERVCRSRGCGGRVTGRRHYCKLCLPRLVESIRIRRVCECGTAKAKPSDPCCQRCAELDGLLLMGDDGRARLLQSLRDMGGAATYDELSDSADMTERHVLRLVSVLEGEGIVTREHEATYSKTLMRTGRGYVWRPPTVELARGNDRVRVVEGSQLMARRMAEGFTLVDGTRLDQPPPLPRRPIPDTIRGHSGEVTVHMVIR